MFKLISFNSVLITPNLSYNSLRGFMGTRGEPAMEPPVQCQWSCKHAANGYISQ